MSMCECESTRRRREATAPESSGSSLTARCSTSELSGIGTSASGQLLERVEDLDTPAPEAPIVPGDDGQPVATGGGGDVAVGKGHPEPGLVERHLLLRPHVRDGHAEAQYAPLPCVEQLPKPLLQRLALPSLLRAYPVRELGNDDRARVAGRLFPLQPGDHALVAAP